MEPSSAEMSPKAACGSSNRGALRFGLRGRRFRRGKSCSRTSAEARQSCDIDADAADREIHAGRTEADAAQQQNEHDHVPERPGAHPCGEIQAMEAREQ